MSSGFNGIAPYYDRLAKLVFGDQIAACQSHFITQVNEGDNILIVGGGTGAFLPALLSRKKDLRIDFVEPSTPMMDRAKSRAVDLAPVNFFRVSIFDFVPVRKYDAVVLPFILDLFPQDEVEKLIGRVTSFCSPQARLIVADFAVTPTSPYWQPLIMKLMYVFFRFTCGITARHMPDWGTALRVAQWNLKAETHFFRGMMGSFLFRR